MLPIVNITGEWLWNSANFKGADDEANLYVEKGHNHTQCFVLCSFNMLDLPDSEVFYWLIVQYMQECFCFVQGHGWKVNKKIEQWVP